MDELVSLDFGRSWFRIHCVYIIEGIAAYKSSIEEVCILYNETGTVIGSVITKSMPFGYSQSQLSSKKVSRYGKHVYRYAALELVWTYVSAPMTQAPERIFRYSEDIVQMLAILRRNECAQTIPSYGAGDKAQYADPDGPRQHLTCPPCGTLFLTASFVLQHWHECIDWRRSLTAENSIGRPSGLVLYSHREDLVDTTFSSKLDSYSKLNTSGIQSELVMSCLSYNNSTGLRAWVAATC